METVLVAAVLMMQLTISAVENLFSKHYCLPSELSVLFADNETNRRKASTFGAKSSGQSWFKQDRGLLQV